MPFGFDFPHFPIRFCIRISSVSIVLMFLIGCAAINENRRIPALWRRPSNDPDRYLHHALHRRRSCSQSDGHTSRACSCGDIMRTFQSVSRSLACCFKRREPGYRVLFGFRPMKSALHGLSRVAMLDLASALTVGRLTPPYLPVGLRRWDVPNCPRARRVAGLCQCVSMRTISSGLRRLRGQRIRRFLSGSGVLSRQRYDSSNYAFH